MHRLLAPSVKLPLTMPHPPPKSHKKKSACGSSAEAANAPPAEHSLLPCRLARDYYGLILRNRVERRFIDVQMRHDQFRRRVGQP
ncbi:MAG: hypothetical protein JWR69_2914, partial [Pedosphaera sp.]|nr:hypothetical protein [Pedosphaera sp.]